jgi:cyclic pyranopterin phosphate synthase
VECSSGTVAALRAKALPKGDVLTVAKIAGIQAAKRTDAMIPLCHALPLSCVDVNLEVYEGGVRVFCTVATDARTGVEMEALTGASIAALTIYDMCKSVDKTMEINGLRVSRKVKESLA